ncbi:hypothetical protein GEMRC1_006014 [Eukaryota sp. GEM-RC1]
MVAHLKVLIADKCDPTLPQILTGKGHTVQQDPSLKEASLSAAIAEMNPDVIMVRSTKVQKEQLDASSDIKMVIRLGAGYDTIDTAYAKEKGVSVCNTPGTNSVAVAELAFGLIVCLDRFLADNVILARQGKWNKAEFSKAKGLKGQTVGLIGFGNIGKALAARAKAFEMNVIVWSRSLTPEIAAKFGVEHAQTALEVAEKADIVSLHVANKPETKGMCNAEFFDKMKNGACFINTARAACVVEEDLINAMNTKGIRAGIDVPAGEPSTGTGDFESPLTKHPNAYVSHHIGASTEQAAAAVSEVALQVVDAFSTSGETLNRVNA